jgi:hypothetical protein
MKNAGNSFEHFKHALHGSIVWTLRDGIPRVRRRQRRLADWWNGRCDLVGDLQNVVEAADAIITKHTPLKRLSHDVQGAGHIVRLVYGREVSKTQTSKTYPEGHLNPIARSVAKGGINLRRKEGEYVPDLPTNPPPTITTVTTRTQERLTVTMTGIGNAVVHVETAFSRIAAYGKASPETYHPFKTKICGKLKRQFPSAGA